MSGRDDPPELDTLVTVPTYRDRPATIAADPDGIDLDGRPIRVPVLETGRWSLLVFLSSSCDGCQPIWLALEDPVGRGLSTDESVVAITRDPGEEDVADVRRLASGSVPVVMSSATWSAFRVQGPPFFALVDGRRPADVSDGGTSRRARRGHGMSGGGPVRVTTEGVAWSVPQVAGDVRRARELARRAPTEG